jgi:dimethylamine monooxygenase subunit A
MTPETVGRRQHLRVELQTLHRLPRSNAIAFPIRCYLARLEELVTVPKWGRRLHRMVRDIPDELATYKGFIRNKPLMLDFLRQYDDGAPTSPGFWPD